MSDYRAYLIKHAYYPYPSEYDVMREQYRTMRDPPRDIEAALMEHRMREMEERAEAERRRRVEANKFMLRTNPAMLQAIEQEITSARDIKGRGRIRRVFNESQESPLSAAVVPAIGGGLFGGSLGVLSGIALNGIRRGGSRKALAAMAGIGAGLGALGGGAIGYGRPGRRLAKLKGIGEGLEGFQSYHEQLPEEGLDEGYRYGPFSEAHQELARKLIGQSAAG